MTPLADETGGKRPLEAALADSGWFAELPAALQEQVAARLAMRKLAAGDSLYRQGETPEGLYLIVSGQIRTIGTAEDGVPSLLSVLRPGEWTGFLGMLDGEPNPFTTEAVMPTEIAMLPRAAVAFLFSGSVQHLEALAKPLFAIQRFAYSYLANTNGRPPVRMVAQRLLDLGRCIYLPGAPHAPVLHAINQDDIAAAAYLSRPTANRALQELLQKGAITIGYGRVEIVNVPLLFDIATGQTERQSAPAPALPAGIDWDEPTGQSVATDAVTNVLGAGGWFPQLPPAVQEQLRAFMIVRQVAAGDAIYRQGDMRPGLFGIVSGQARVTSDGSDGNRILISLLQPGEWSAFVPVLDGGPQPFTVLASRPSVVVMLPKSAIDMIFRSDRGLYDKLLAPMLRILHYTYEYLIETNRRPPARLVAQRVLDLARSTHLPEMRPRDFVDNLTQDDIAMATGLTRPTVNRVCKDLTGRGLIRLGYGKISITDPAGLIALAKGQGG